MARTSIRIPDEVLEGFDRKLCRLKADGDIPIETSRSQAIASLMQAWADDDPLAARADAEAITEAITEYELEAEAS